MNTTKLLSAERKLLRRSVRLMSREKDDSKSLQVQLGPLGYFELLPIELLYRILELLSVKELSMLTICSKCLRNHIEVYRSASQVQRRIVPEIKDNFGCTSADAESLKRYFAELGLLVKRATCLYPTKDRLRLMLQFANKLPHYPSQNMPTLVLTLQCFGILVHTVIAGWDECECLFVHTVLESISQMRKHTQRVLEALPGSCSGLEMYVRHYYRLVYLEFANPGERAFWLSRIFKPWPLVHQAKLLYLIFGPIHQERIEWWEMSESVTFGHPSIIEMAQVLRTLQKSPEWSEDSLFTVLEELADTPDEWLPENIANLLFVCGKPIIVTFAGNKLVNGKITELANLIVYLTVVCKKYSKELTWIVDVIDSICKISENGLDKLKFIKVIPETFREALIDFHEIAELGADDDRETEFRLFVEAQNAFLAAIISRAFKTSEE